MKKIDTERDGQEERQKKKARRGEKQTHSGQEGGKSGESAVQEAVANINFPNHSSQT